MTDNAQINIGVSLAKDVFSKLASKAALSVIDKLKEK